MTVEADAFTDGDDALVCDVRARHTASSKWTSCRMQPLFDDRWRATFPVSETGLYRFSVRARIDEFATWRDDLRERRKAGHDLAVELQVGADIVERAAGRARSEQRRLLTLLADSLRSSRDGLDHALPRELTTWASAGPGSEALAGIVFGEPLASVMGALADPGSGTTSEVYSVLAERAKARFSSWYELFPRSASGDPGRHGTFKDVRRNLDYVERMGFDVVYLPPIHPIGTTARKGKEELRRLDRRPGEPLGHRGRCGRPHGDPSRPGLPR